jgi:hypothetical protein
LLSAKRREALSAHYMLKGAREGARAIRCAREIGCKCIPIMRFRCVNLLIKRLYPINFRKSSKHLKTKAVKELSQAHHHAAKIGKTLNTFLTVAPARGSHASQTSASPADYFQSFRNLIGVWVRRHTKKSATYVWTAENRVQGGDEHMHMLLSLPPKLIPELAAALVRWCPGLGAIHIRRDNGQVRQHPCGYRGSTLLYMSKQMLPSAMRSLSGWPPGQNQKFRQRVNRQQGGAFLGRRYGISNDLNRISRMSH